jgi:hypothetical protein
MSVLRHSLPDRRELPPRRGSGSPQTLRPEIARIIEALARDAAHRENRRAAESAADHKDEEK